MTDSDLSGCFDLGFEALRLAKRASGPYTAILGVLGLGWGLLDVLLHDKWVVAAVVVALLGLVVGWLIDLAVRFALLPIVRTFAPAARGTAAHLLVGALPAAAAIAAFAVL